MEIECKFVIAGSGVYSCEVLEASIAKPNVDIVKFKGTHCPKKNNNDVSIINFIRLKVESFPRNLQTIFPNLSHLTIQYCGLKEIFREDLIGLEKLVELDLEHNQLKSLPDDLFTNMPNLKQVRLNYNKIEFATSKLIEPLVGNKLGYFALGANKSIDEYYWPASNSGCRTIPDLMAKIDEKCKPPQPQCYSNCFIAAEKEIFKGFNELRMLGRFNDFVIVVGSKEFPVNKIVLALQSAVFGEMFEVKTNGRFASKLEISDSNAEAIEAFLDYLYERKQPNAQNAVEIFKLAAKYEVAKLKVICEQIICESLDESNAFETFKLACGPHKSVEIKFAAFKQIQEKFDNELDDDLMNNPEQLQELVEAKMHMDNLMRKARAKRND